MLWYNLGLRTASHTAAPCPLRPLQVRQIAGLYLKNSLKQQYATTSEVFRAYIKVSACVAKEHKNAACILLAALTCRSCVCTKFEESYKICYQRAVSVGLRPNTV